VVQYTIRFADVQGASPRAALPAAPTIRTPPTQEMRRQQTAEFELPRRASTNFGLL